MNDVGVWEARDIWRDGVWASWLLLRGGHARCGQLSPGTEPLVCGRLPHLAGRHFATALVEGTGSLIIAAWPGVHRPVETDMRVEDLAAVPRQRGPVRLGDDAPFPRSWWVALDDDGEPAVWTTRDGVRVLVIRRENAGGPMWVRLEESLPGRGDCRVCTVTPCRDHASHRPCHEGVAVHGAGSPCVVPFPVLHRTDPICVTCGTPYPCPTARALGVGPTTDEDL